MGRMPIVLVGPPLKKRAGLQVQVLARFYNHARSSVESARVRARNGLEEWKERSSPKRREARRESLWPAVNCQHLMSALWRAARTAAVTLVMAGAFLTTALHDSSPFLSTVWTTMYQFSSCQCAFLSAFY